MLISDVIDVHWTDRSRETDVRVETETSMTVGDTGTDGQVFSDSAESSDEIPFQTAVIFALGC